MKKIDFKVINFSKISKINSQISNLKSKILKSKIFKNNKPKEVNGYRAVKKDAKINKLCNSFGKIGINETKLMRSIVIILISIMILICFFYMKNKIFMNEFKNESLGNNISSQDIINNVLNIGSYNLVANVRIVSNKNENYYKIEQTYIKNELNKQKILEPKEIEGITIENINGEVIMENAKLELRVSFEELTNFKENIIDLSTFIHEYTNSNVMNFIESEEEIILINQDNKLYISKTTGLPVRLEIYDTNKNLITDILYDKVEFNI